MATFDKQINLLRAFGQLEESWRDPLEEAVGALVKECRRKRKRATRLITQSIVEMLSLEVEAKLSAGELPEETQERLEVEYKAALEQIEQRSRASVESVYAQHRLERSESALEVLEAEHLFSEESWRLFGLRKSEILTFSAIGGAAVGGIIDASLGGGTFLMGSLVGGLLGASTAFFAGDSLVEARILALPLGRRLLVVGPTKSINLPHVVFGRARLHRYLVANRTHAERSRLELPADSVLELSEKQKRGLETHFAKIRKGDRGFERREKLEAAIDAIFADDDSLPELRTGD